MLATSKHLALLKVVMENGQELTKDQVQFVIGIRKSLSFVGQLDLQGYSTIKWNMKDCAWNKSQVELILVD